MHDSNTRIRGKVFAVTGQLKQAFKKQNMEKKKTLVIGASANPARYSFLAVQSLSAHQHPVVALGLKKGTIGHIEIETEKKAYEQIDTISLYVNPSHQKE